MAMATANPFPYATSQPGLKGILAGVPGWGTTNKIDQKWLAGVGFKGGTAAQSLSVLRAVGIVGSNGEPTELWAALRTRDRAKFAAGIKKHYADLFATYPDAQRKDTEALLDFVRSKTSYGEDAQKRAVATFKTLCEFGDFNAYAPHEDENDAAEAQPKKGAKAKPPKAPANGGGVALTVNLQLQLPASESGEVYEKLFAAMAKHLKGQIGTE
jgi:hypothetical protein